jgi:hypothetical protein
MDIANAKCRRINVQSTLHLLRGKLFRKHMEQRQLYNTVTKSVQFEKLKNFTEKCRLSSQMIKNRNQ